MMSQQPIFEEQTQTVMRGLVLARGHQHPRGHLTAQVAITPVIIRQERFLDPPPSVSALPLPLN
jgi:hypothetical protein